MVEVVLKLTKKAPVRSVSLDDFKVYLKYLYTDTGLVSRWSMAMKVAYPEEVRPPTELKFRLEAMDNDQ